MSDFIKFNVTDELYKLQEETIKKISKTGKVKIGINEVTKAVERGDAKIVLIAQDVDPAEIVMHIPVISKEKKIPFTYFKTRKDLGKAVGISASASSAAITDAGVSKKELSSLINKINEVASGKKPEAKKPEAKKETKTETKKPEEKPETKKPEEKPETKKPEEKPKEEKKEDKK